MGMLLGRSEDQTRGGGQGMESDTFCAWLVPPPPSSGCCRGIPVSAPLLIIPIIMAHYENVINNREDIVVAISHMVEGLCHDFAISIYFCLSEACSHDKLKFCSPCTPH